MKKFTFLLILLFVTSMSFSQLIIEKLWEFSVASAPTSPKPSWLATDDGRSMVIKDGKLYIMMRTTSSIKIIDTRATDIIAAVTTPTSLTLSGYLAGSNCLSFTDDGQLLGGSYAGATLKISKINMTTGVTTQFLEKNPASGIGRFDYFSTFGDFSATGTGYILSSTCPSAGVGGFNIYKWDVVNGVIDPATFSTIIRPTVFGSSSIVIPVDASSFYAMSASTNPELFTKEGLATPFANVFTSQGAAAATGMATFPLNGRNYFIRTEGRFGGMTFYDLNGDVSLATKLTISTPVLGATANTTVKTTIVTESISNTVSNVYILAPNNGIAAYKITDLSTGMKSASEEVTQINRTSKGVEVLLQGEAAIELYSINGVLIDKAKVNGTYSHDLNNGVYIIRVNGKASKFIK